MDVILIGRDMVLLRPVDGENIEVLVKETKLYMENHFYHISQWSLTEVPRERYTWVRCMGVHVHA